MKIFEEIWENTSRDEYRKGHFGYMPNFSGNKSKN
jgi:hypothetical protein